MKIDNQRAALRLIFDKGELKLQALVAGVTADICEAFE